MRELFYPWLQLFADAEGGGQGTTGENTAAAGQEDTGTAEPAATASARMTWEQIKADPEYNQHLQELVQSRLKNAKDAQISLQKLNPALQKLAGKYGLDSQNLDYDALSQAVCGEKTEQVDLPAHYRSLLQQEKRMQEQFPDFSLQKELENPAFVRLTAPHVGLSVEDAYYVLHRRQLQLSTMAQTAQTTARQISSAIAAGARRPRENGTVSHTPGITGFDYRTADKQQRSDLKRQIRLAAARGEKLYPGGY